MRNLAFSLSLFVIFMIPWEDVVTLPGIGTGVKFVGLLVALFWVATVMATGQLRKPHPFHLMAFLYVAWNALSILWSGNPNQTLSQIITFVQLFGLSFILWDLYTTREKVLLGLAMYLLGAYVVLGDTLINYLAGTTFYYERFSASGTNPDDLGGILALGVPIAWFLAGSLNTGKASFWLKTLSYPYIPVALMGIALSGTRTALIATVPGLLFGLASLTRLQRWVRIVIFLILLTAGYFLLPFVPLASLQRLSTTGSELASGNLNGRIAIWRQGLISFNKHPLLGVGSNMYRSVNTAGKVLGKVAHNSFISILVEVGLIGLALFGLMLLIVIIQAWSQSKWRTSFWLAMLVTWAIGASTLTWENRKHTWLFLSLVVVNANLAKPYLQSVVAAIPSMPTFSVGRKQQVYVK